jgi:transketolase
MAISVRVVSVPCMDLFFEQDEDYRSSMLGDEPVRIAIEAGVRMGWDAFIGAGGVSSACRPSGLRALRKLYATSASPPMRPSRQPCWPKL